MKTLLLALLVVGFSSSAFATCPLAKSACKTPFQTCAGTGSTSSGTNTGTTK